MTKRMMIGYASMIGILSTAIILVLSIVSLIPDFPEKGILITLISVVVGTPAVLFSIDVWSNFKYPYNRRDWQ